MDITRGAKKGELKKVIETFKLDDKWRKTSWAIKTARAEKRASLTDFDRFKVMTLRKKRSLIRHKLCKVAKK
jgi:large subunit ribosomal protein L14e